MLTYAELLALAAPRIPALPYVTSSHGEFALTPDPRAQVRYYLPDEVSVECEQVLAAKAYRMWGGCQGGVEMVRVCDYPETAITPQWRARQRPVAPLPRQG